MIRPHAAFDVQTTLARITRLRVETRKLDTLEALYVIGFKWELALDEDDFYKLYNATESDAQFREAFDKLKPTCLRYNAFRAER